MLARLARCTVRYFLMAPRKDIFGALDRLAQAERDFLRREFLAPVIRGAGVEVKIEGVRMHMAVQPADFEGWGIFRPLSYMQCTLIQPAGAVQRQRYLDLFAAVNLILCQKIDRQWVTVPASRSDSRF